MKIDSLMTAEGPDVYYTSAFRNVLEDHLWILKKHVDTRIIEIEPQIADKYRSDLFGLFYYYNINFELHWITMRLNGFTSPADNDETLNIILVPSTTYIERIRSMFVTQNKIKV